MAKMNNTNLKILDKKRIELLKRLNELSFIKDFVMGGGTSLSLQLCLRDSYDFDFFSLSHFNPNHLLEELQDIFKEKIKVEHIHEKISSLNILIDDIQVSFFEYNFKTLYQPINLDGFSNIYLFDPKDIMLMKIIAINQRGSRKDFFDFAKTVSLLNITPSELSSLIEKKYNDSNILLTFVYSLTYFDDAENDALPKAYLKYDWEKIKSFCLDYSKQLTKIILK